MKCAIVDAYGIGRFLPGALRRYGVEPIHVRSQHPDVHLAYQPADFAVDLQHPTRAERLVADQIARGDGRDRPGLLRPVVHRGARRPGALEQGLRDLGAEPRGDARAGGAEGGATAGSLPLSPPMSPYIAASWGRMKPALSRGEISCIGATTIREYRRYLDKDRSLLRRFQATP